MGLFDIFKSKNNGPEIKDLVWMDLSGKFSGVINLLQEHKELVLIAWFQHTADKFGNFFQSKSSIIPEIRMANQVTASSVTGKTVVFLEHHPFRSKEENLIADWAPGKIFVLNSLDEPIFSIFGGDKIQTLMLQLGIKVDEVIEHSMINKSIANAQHKIEKKVVSEYLANSIEEWFAKNLPAA